MSVASQETGALQSRTPTQESRFHRQVPPEPQIPTDYQIRPDRQLEEDTEVPTAQLDDEWKSGRRFTRFIDHSDGTATDLQTGLMWSPLGSPEETNWEEAVAYCRQLELSGHSDWRLPTIEELESIALPERSNAVLAFGKYPTYAPEVFVLPDSGSLKGTRRAMSADRSSARSAWYFDFINGRRSSANASYRDAIRAYCVRP